MSPSTHLRGKSIIDLLWEDLDDTMDILMDTCERCERLVGAHTRTSHEPEATLQLEYAVDEYRGRAQGVAYALALMSNPYLRNVDEVRKLAKERYDQRSQGQPVTPLKTRPDLTVSEEA